MSEERGRPLWQIVLPLLFLFFVVHRAALAVMLYLSGADVALCAAYAVQIVAGLATAVGISLGRAWVFAALLALGVSVVGTAVLEGLFLGVRPMVAVIAEALVVALGTAALLFVLRREFGTRGGESP